MPLITSTEYLDIGGVPLATPAWHVAAGGLLPLIQGPDVRGSDRIVPLGAAVPYRRRATVTKRAIPMVILGALDLDGVAHPSEARGLVANVAYLRANVTDPTGVGDGTRVATLHLLGGNRTGPVHVESFELGGDGETSILAVLTLSLPNGALA